MSTISTAPPSGVSVPNAGDFLEFEKPLLRILTDIAELEREQSQSGRDVSVEVRQQRTRYKAKLRHLYANLTPWETVLVARHPKRPLTTDYMRMIFRDVCELHGDRAFGDDKAIITAFARIGAHKVLLVGHNKGKDVKERIKCNFGCAHPEGYRKSLLKMRLAEKFGLPIVCLIDTQGAYPGIGSEERGISQAIAVNLLEMSRIKAPIVCVVIGEGGSGGALGIGVGDRVAMLQHSFYSVISPEGCAAILWKTAEQRKAAAEALRLTAKDLHELGIIDAVIPEPLGGAHRSPEEAAANVEAYIVEALNELKRRTPVALVQSRYDRIRHMASFFESPSEAKKAAEARERTARKTTSRTSRLRDRLTISDTVEA